jgi:hypothetical protein
MDERSISPQTLFSSSSAQSPKQCLQVHKRWRGHAATGTLSIKMHDKLAALVALGKHLGMFVQRTQNSNVHYVISDKPLTEDEWVKRYVTPD